MTDLLLHHLVMKKNWSPKKSSILKENLLMKLHLLQPRKSPVGVRFRFVNRQTSDLSILHILEAAKESIRSIPVIHKCFNKGYKKQYKQYKISKQYEDIALSSIFHDIH